MQSLGLPILSSYFIQATKIFLLSLFRQGKNRCSERLMKAVFWLLTGILQTIWSFQEEKTVSTRFGTVMDETCTVQTLMNTSSHLLPEVQTGKYLQ